MTNVFNAGLSVVESQAQKIREEAVNIIQYFKLEETAKNLTKSFTKILHPSGQLTVNVNLDLAPDLHILAEKFLYIIPLCFVFLLIIIACIFMLTCKAKREYCGYCVDDYYRDNKADESIY